ncbi:MAG: S8 family serine peptidase [Reyranella sp.]|uniref:S8 family serine peptidase n=1 Tax=Reyranella sp. TaxID=1929291 RepID=UPI003D0B0B56
MAGKLRLLVRAQPGSEGARLAFGDGRTPVALSPLFQSIRPATGLGLTAGTTWQLAETEASGLSPWDACHLAVQDGLGIAGGIEFAEPDLEQPWLWSTASRQAFGMTGECPTEGTPQDGDVYALGPYSTWHKGTLFSQLGEAAQAVGPVGDARRVRIAHLDTGYDASHKTRPLHLNTALQRNFVDSDRPHDATDRPTALLNPMLGHGTGTIGLLAGNKFDEDNQFLGGAPECDIVPIRVANWVVLFRNSAIARAFDYVHGLWDQPQSRVHVVTMSMGGIASAAWADAINALYERGIFVVTAAGNNFFNLPTRYIVYPARFRRVVAACGVMADERAYADLPARKMAGCYGPRSKEATAMAAYTPNVPWPKFGCADVVDWDGGGTSAATPQIAAAAALWMQKHAATLEGYSGWQRVEAVRRALFASAKAPANDALARRLGRGVLRANAALAIAPAEAGTLVKEEEDSASFSLFRVLTGIGLQGEPSPRLRMVELEALQLSQQSRDVETLLDDLDPGDPALAGSDKARKILEALADHPGASRTFRRLLARRLATAGPLLRQPDGAPPSADDAAADFAGSPLEPETARPAAVEAPSTPSTAFSPVPPPPAHRALRVYAFDPLVATRLETSDLNEAILEIDWEADLKPGPVGEYFEVVDIDPPSESAYAPVDLNHPSILATRGLAPTEGNPQFHQQMVYAVAMNTVERFNMALGREAQWAPRLATVDGEYASRFVRRLRIYPHALRERNAYYSPVKMALLFGYFNASASDAGGNLPGGLVFTCLSHDIIAHETTHALLDGLHPRFKERSSLDMLAFHEAFADIVALFQHFTLPEALRSELARARGDLSVANLLGGLALQFGEAIGRRGALRSAISRVNEKGQPERVEPSPTDYRSATKAHDLGKVLVAAVFDAFLQVYKRKTDDLVRLASGGTGILPEGRIPHDLVERLAQEAARIAGRVLNICIRALDYCPPVDLTFGEYLRALITADRDLVQDDPLGYRVAFISAFRARGIFPTDVSNLSVDALTWQEPDIRVSGLAEAFNELKLDWRIDCDRHQAFLSSNEDAAKLHDFLSQSADPHTLAELGIVKTDRRQKITLGKERGKISKIEVHSVRPARRVAPSGKILNDVIIVITQSWKPEGIGLSFRGGCTIICDRETGRIRYVIRKRIGNRRSIDDQLKFRMSMTEGSAMRNYFAEDRIPPEPFALTHRD